MLKYEDINKIDEIIPHLFISNWEQSNNIITIEKHNIKAVLTIETLPKPTNIVDYYHKNNIDFLFLYLHDFPIEDISQFFEKSYNFINYHIKKGNNVLVHCRAGVSRSVTLVLNFIIRKMYETKKIKVCPCYVLNYALYLIKQKRHVANPNEGFMKQLLLKSHEYNNIYT